AVPNASPFPAKEEINEFTRRNGPANLCEAGQQCPRRGSRSGPGAHSRNPNRGGGGSHAVSGEVVPIHRPSRLRHLLVAIGRPGRTDLRGSLRRKRAGWRRKTGTL